MKCTLLLTLLLLTPVTTAQTVHVVDSQSAPGTDFTAIQPAIDAAADGDIVYVRFGPRYQEHLLIDGKSITLQGMRSVAGAQPDIDGFTIQDLSPGQSVVVRNFGVTRNAFPILVPYPLTIVMTANEGPVWLEQLTTVDPNNPIPGRDFTGIQTIDCDAVVLSECSLRVNVAGVLSTLDPIEFRDSSVELYDCMIDNVGLTTSEGLDPTVTAAAVLATRGTLGVWGSTILGSDANANCLDGSCGLQVLGEVGLRAVETSVSIQDSDIQGGRGVLFGSYYNMPARSIEGGTLTDLTSKARSFEVASPVREGETVEISAIGEADDLVWVYFSLQPAPTFLHRIFDGAFVLGSPFSSMFLGVVPASGVLDLSFPAPTVALGSDGFELYVQTLFLDDAGQGFVFSEPTAVTHLAPGF